MGGIAFGILFVEQKFKKWAEERNFTESSGFYFHPPPNAL
jgi:hypothetical protein